jgi:hypothetical protein
VFATDVSNRALERTKAGRYRTSEITGLSQARRARHLTGGPDYWEIADATRRRLGIDHHNLVTDPLPEHLARCQVVFCRNVLIYFSPPQATAFLTRLAEGLAPGACLFLGYAETIWQVTDLFEPVRIGESFEFHRRRGPAAAPAPAREQLSARPRRVPANERQPRPRRVATEVAGTVGADLVALSEEGQAAANRGDYQAAVTSFRKCAYVAPDDPMGHVNLGLALEATGDRSAANRAFVAARGALDRSAPDTLAAALGGYHVEELRSLLDSKQEEACQ